MEQTAERAHDRTNDDEPYPVHAGWMPAASGSKRSLALALQLRLLRLELLVGEDARFVEVAQLPEVRVGRALRLRPLGLAHQFLHLAASLLEFVDADAALRELQRVRAGERPFLHEPAIGDDEQHSTEERQQPDALGSPAPDCNR